jgi:hypothetical protein
MIWRVLLLNPSGMRPMNLPNQGTVVERKGMKLYQGTEAGFSQ